MEVSAAFKPEDLDARVRLTSARDFNIFRGANLHRGVLGTDMSAEREVIAGQFFM